mmetsp:Transcript_32565/g.71472  ORF Transcript_32565/g.71472 Transcript_32565/m.71472 type:complete len:204 (+) Transcript_32565:1384-1995(+)
MHDVFPVWIGSLNDKITFPIKALQSVNRGLFPGLVYGLKTKDSRVATVSIYNFLNDAEGMVDIVVIDVAVVASVPVECSHPFCRPYWPMLEGDEISRVHVESRSPLETQRLTAVVKTILRILMSVNINKDRQAIFMRPIQNKINIIECSICTTNVRPIRRIHEITNWQPEGVYSSTFSQLLDNVFSNPCIPVPTQLAIALFRS